jgi:hypothetical protein
VKIKKCMNGCDKRVWLDGECRPCWRITQKKAKLSKPGPRDPGGTFIKQTRWVKEASARFEIYLIEGPGCWYVGSTFKTTEQRFPEHIRAARRGKVNTRLARKMRELGPENFRVRVLEVGHGDPGPVEQHWIDRYERSKGEGLNTAKAASRTLTKSITTLTVVPSTARIVSLSPAGQKALKMAEERQRKYGR